MKEYGIKLRKYLSDKFSYAKTWVAKDIWFCITLILSGVFIVAPLLCDQSFYFVNPNHLQVDNLIACAGVIVAIFVAVFTYRIYTKQLSLMDKQTSISEEQTKIATTQTEIMEQQNKIALFEKRYGVYVNLQSMAAVISLIVDHKDSLDYAALMQIVDVANEANKFKSYAEFYMNMKAFMPKISMLFPEVDSSHTLILLGECEKLLLYAWKKQKFGPKNSINHLLELSNEHKKIVDNLENGQEAYLEFISEIESQLQLK